MPASSNTTRLSAISTLHRAKRGTNVVVKVFEEMMDWAPNHSRYAYKKIAASSLYAQNVRSHVKVFF